MWHLRHQFVSKEEEEEVHRQQYSLLFINIASRYASSYVCDPSLSKWPRASRSMAGKDKIRRTTDGSSKWFFPPTPPRVLYKNSLSRYTHFFRRRCCCRSFFFPPLLYIAFFFFFYIPDVLYTRMSHSAYWTERNRLFLLATVAKNCGSFFFARARDFLKMISEISMSL